MFTNQRWPHGSTTTPPAVAVRRVGRAAGHAYAPRCSASAIVASQSGTYSCSDTALASGSGATTPISGWASDSMISAPLNRSWAWPTRPSGITIGSMSGRGAEHLLVPGDRLPGAVDGDVGRERRQLVGHPGVWRWRRW